VDMLGYAGAGGFAQVHAQIHALGTIYLAQLLVSDADEREEFLSRGLVDTLERIGVLERNHHEVPGSVGIAIQNNVVEARTVNDEGSLVILLFGKIAEDAALGTVFFCNVLVAPGIPETVQGLGYPFYDTGVSEDGCSPAGACAELLTTSFNSLLGLK